jgi:ketosteroid isomerase-like protein
MWPGFFMLHAQALSRLQVNRDCATPLNTAQLNHSVSTSQMKKAKLQAATVGGTPDDVEQAFYEALHNADIQQLMACWAEEDEIVCVQPGGGRLIGAGAIRQAFEAMFSNGSVQAHPERIHKIESLASAVHHLVEKVDVLTPQGAQTAWVLATNVYHKTPQGWRLVAHHTSPGTPNDVADEGRKAPVLH